MKKIPALETERLILRPFSLNDAKDVQRLAGDFAVAETTLAIPHPYEDGMAEEWIGTHEKKSQEGTEIVFAITHKTEKYLIGAIGISQINTQFEKAEIGYWIGKPYWNKGYCTEAVQAVLKYCFESLKLNKVYAAHFINNPPSGRVMQKAGMKKEGVLRQNVKKGEEYFDTPVYGILRSEYLAICFFKDVKINVINLASCD